MCPPDYYEVAYEINPWMSTRRRVDQPKASKQWHDYYDLLTRKLGVKVELVKPVKGLPDLVFTANGGLVWKRLFIRANFRHQERKGEENHFEAWFRRKGYKVKKLKRPFCFEGEGDALFVGEDLYTGYHFRSDLEAHDEIGGMTRLSYFALELADKRFYHLDTCFAPLNEKTALVYLKAFEPYSQMVLWESISDLIEVSREEALRFACNAFVAGKKAVIPEGCPQVTKALESRGFEVFALDFSEYIKAGGAAKCLVLNL